MGASPSMRFGEPHVAASQSQGLGRTLGVGNRHLDLGGKEAKHLRNVKTQAVQR